MTEVPAKQLAAGKNDEMVSLLTVGSVLLRSRRMILALSLVGAVLGLLSGLLLTRKYTSTATFIPQSSDGAVSSLAIAASQFGIRMPNTGGGGWGVATYVELLRSRALLEPIAVDTFVVAEEGGRRAALMDLLEIRMSDSSLRLEYGIREVREIVTPAELKTIGAVKVTVRTKWPSVSFAIAERLLSGINRFNLQTRQSQAAGERQFVEGQALEAERALREAEDRLQAFQQRNRVIARTSDLNFENDRLAREVSLRQQVYTMLLQNREEARMREVRDTPVITVLETPRLPSGGEPRRSVQKGVLGGVAGAIVGILIALFLQAMDRARREAGEPGNEFFRLLDEATPRWLRRRAR